MTINGIRDLLPAEISDATEGLTSYRLWVVGEAASRLDFVYSVSGSDSLAFTSALHNHGSLLLFIQFVPNKISCFSDIADIAFGTISVVICQCHNYANHCVPTTKLRHFSAPRYLPGK